MLVVALFDDFGSASRAVEGMVATGFPRGTISLIAQDSKGEYSATLDADEGVSAYDRAGTEAAVGTLAGLGISVIYGVIPFLVVGPLAAVFIAAVNAVEGDVVEDSGKLDDLGIGRSAMHRYAEAVRNGSALVAVQVTDTEVGLLKDLLQKYYTDEMQAYPGR
jgi:hypothetical protein